MFKYPKEFYLWKTDIPEEEKLQIIGTFPHKERILKAIGIEKSSLVKSFGITDQEEIVARQNLLWFFIQNLEIREWIKRAKACFTLPCVKSDFLVFFNPKEEHNFYWRQIRTFIKLCDKSGVLPQRLGQLIYLLRDSLSSEKEERKMGEEIHEQIEKAAYIEGISSFIYDDNGTVYHFNSEENHVHGYYEFSFRLNYWQKLKTWFFTWLKMAKQKRIKEKMVICEMTSEIREDVKKGLEVVLEKIEEKLREKKANKKNRYLLDNLIFKVYFLYNKYGLNIRIYGVESRLPEAPFSFEKDSYNGYSSEMDVQVKKAKEKVEKSINNFYNKAKAAKKLFEIGAADIPFFYNDFKVDSPQMDIKYKWLNLDDLYRNEFAETTEEAMKHRQFFQKQIGMLKDVARLVDMFRITSKKHNLPLCQPENIPNGHIISFDKIYPIYLSEKGDVKPISNLPKLNGNAIGMSGDHEGGKTTIGLTLIELIYLNQSGLLCFGSNITINIKKVLGLVFIPPGTDGSLCSHLLDQLKEILVRVKEAKNPGDFFVSLDELGGGTQNDPGLEFGVNYINTLVEHKVSVYFNSQITDIFENLEGEKVKCFQVDRQHKIVPGIGTGKFREMVKEKGIDKLLIKKR